MLVCPSPLGPLELRATDTGLCGARFLGSEPALEGQRRDVASSAAIAIVDQAAQELHEYFAGQRQGFAVPLDLRGTVFQLSVWQALLRIAYGETMTYRQLAAAAGRPAAVRAAGAANGANPLPIFVPCHRVIGSNGTLTGYGGGLDAKRWLLDLEQPAPDG